MSVLAALTPAAAYQRPGETERVSIASDGTEPNGQPQIGSELPYMSSDARYVVFDSLANNLVPNDANGSQYDVFMHDRVTGLTTQISVSSQGAGGENASFGARISGDGRYVVFESQASNFAPNDEGWRDIFLHDNETGQTTRISNAIGGGPSTADSYAAVISRDGRIIAFDSEASDLVPSDTNNAPDVFVYDRDSGALELISKDSNGVQANSFSLYPSLSADGRYVTFNSRATNLPGNSLGRYQIYRHDRVTHQTVLVSIPDGGGEANASSYGGSISDDGRLIVFDSDASNLVPQDGNGWVDVFVHDMLTGATRRVSVDSAGREGDWDASFGRISGDGRIVAFQSDSRNLVPDDHGARDIFVHDLQSGTTERVSLSSSGAEATFPASDDEFIDQYVWHPAVSRNGRFVSWDSSANNMAPNDNNGVPDVFVRDRGPDLGVGRMSASASGNQVQVSGWVTFPAAQLCAAADPTNDGSSNAAALGLEISGASLLHRIQEGDILFALDVTSIPPRPSSSGRAKDRKLDGAGTPGTTYAFRFGAGSMTYEVRAFPTSPNSNPPGGPFFALYRCDTSCTQVAVLPGSIGSTGNQVLISLPLATLDAGATPTLTALRAYAALGDASAGPVTELDDVDLPNATVVGHSVSVGIAPAGTPESQVAFNLAAPPTNGTFTRTINTCALPAGAYDVWAGVCFGQTCTTSSVPVQLGPATCSTLPLRITAITRAPAGGFLVTGETTPLLEVNIEATSDLFGQFTVIGTATANANGIFEFRDGDAGDLPKRFYRASHP